MIQLLRNLELLWAMLRSFFVQYDFTLVSVLSQPLQTPPSHIIQTAPLPSPPPMPCPSPLPSSYPVMLLSPHNDYLTAPLFNHYYDPYPLTQITLTYTIILLEPICPSVRPSVCLSVGVTKLQVATLARSSREMSRTVHII